MKKRNKVTYADFNKLEKIRVYMEHHKEEVFTPEFMKVLADRKGLRNSIPPLSRNY